MVDLTNDDIMLELAAKAAGYLNWTHCDCGLFIETDSDWFYWNPLSNDGDALWLAMKLRIELKCDGMSITGMPFNVSVSYPKLDNSSSDRQILLVEKYIPDDIFANIDSNFGEFDRRGVMAATRRAIVYAAAEIGRNIK